MKANHDHRQAPIVVETTSEVVGEVQVVMSPAFRERFEGWLQENGLHLFLIPNFCPQCGAADCPYWDDLPTYGIGIRDWKLAE